MKNLLVKEFRLAMHPTVFLFWGLSLMLLIPNYPYYVVLFYTALGLFFVCLTGRENHDIEYSLSLPVRKRDIVTARFTFAVIVEGVQLALCVPIAMLRATFPMPGNEVGMDANIAFFGLGLLMLGLYNYLFFTGYYKAPDQVGKVFTVTSILAFVYIIIAESLTHIIPFFRDVLDTPDPQHLTPKLLTLTAGAAAYALLTWLAWRRSVTSFRKLDL